MSIKKDGTIHIGAEEFAKGMAKSPYLGIQQMVNLDIRSRPGVLRIARQLSKESGSTVDELIRFAGVDYGTGYVYGLGQDGNLYQRTTQGVWSSINDFGTTNDGMFVWKDYAIVLRSGTSALMEAYGPFSGSAAERTFTSIARDHGASASFVSYVTLDDRVYFGADNYLHKLVQVDGQDFDPTDSNTYVKSEDVLILPEGVKITAITEQDTNIIVGTSYGDVATVADLFVWDPNKSGATAQSPDRRIRLSGDGVKHTLLSDNLIYSIVGNNAQLKVSDLTSVEDVITINNISNNPDTEFEFVPLMQSMTNHDDGFVFGLSKDAAEPSLYQYKNGVHTTFTTSQGQVSDGVTIGALLSLNNEQLYVAWENESDSTYGVDVTSTTSRYQNYSAYFISQMYNIGQYMRGKTYQHIGFTLGKKLTADQGIRIKYRTDISDDWTTLGTWDYATLGAVNAYEDKANLPSDLTNLQLRVELTTGTTDTTPELSSVYVM